MNFFRVSAIVFGVLLPGAAWSQTQTPFKDFSETLKTLGFSAIHSSASPKALEPIKIAILDKGFSGLEDARGKTLPDDLIYHPGINEPETQTDHGRVMAEILFQALSNMGRDERFYPVELHLYNVYGFSNFKAAIDNVILRNIDVVLYSEVWEIGGNWDGKGFINQEVNRATNQGILWVNAAGNFAGRTYQASVSTQDDGWVDLPDSNNALIVECRPGLSQLDEDTCLLNATLSWNDFKDIDGIGTDKDLDFVLYDDMMNLIEKSTLDQVLEFGPEGGAGQTQYPREAIRVPLEKGTYFLKVKNRSENFTANDKFRISIDGKLINVPSGQTDESLLNPADNESVITVGASDSDLSSRSKKLGKPDVVAPSKIILQADDTEFRGSSNSAALFAAGVGLYKMFVPSANKDMVLEQLTRPAQKQGRTSRGNSSANIHQRGYDSRQATEQRQQSGTLSADYPEFYIPRLSQ